MMETSPAAPFVVAKPDLLLEVMVIARSNLGASTSKAFDYQRFLKCSRRALAAIIGTERHQTAHSGTESPEKVPNYVLEVFTRVAATDLHRRVPVRDGAGRYVHRRAT
jgi:hypothetical protein